MCVCPSVGTCHSEKRGQIQQGGGLLVSRGAVGDAFFYERQAVRSQAHWEGEKEGRGGAVHDIFGKLVTIESGKKSCSGQKK